MDKTQLENTARHLTHVIEVELNQARELGATLDDLRQIAGNVEHITAHLVGLQAKRQGVTLCDWCNNTATHQVTNNAWAVSHPACAWHLPAVKLDGDTVTRLDLNNPVPA